MKLNETQKEWIEYYSNLGYSSREIERRTGVSKSACNYFLNGRATPQVPQKDGPRVLLFDLESAPSIVAAFGRFKVNVPQDAVVKEGGSLISVCYKFLGDNKVTKLVQTPKEAKAMDDSRLVAELYVAFEEANIIVAHNLDRFDLPLFKTRLLANGFPPPPTVKTVDTLKIAKSMRFSSNKLDSLGSYLELGRKVDHEGIKLWLDCMNGDKKSLDKMLAYNEQDVLLLEKIYLKIRAFDTKPANAGQYFKDSEVHCPVCGSTDLTPTGNSVYTSVSEFPEVECNDCGHKSRTRSTTSTKETRSKLLLTPQK